MTRGNLSVTAGAGRAGGRDGGFAVTVARGDIGQEDGVNTAVAKL